MRKLSVPLAIFALLIVTSYGCTTDPTDDTYENYVVLVSFDGFRWDYPDLFDTPNFDDMAAEGVKAEAFIPSFPTKTFPNHYTMATGLYPDHHGLINNNFWAPDLELLYRIGDSEMVTNPDFYEGEPIWVTAEKQGVKSASFYWVGSEAPIGGVEPTYWKTYDHNFAFDSRVDTVIKWLKLPLQKRPRFVMLYFHEPDAIGHGFGPTHENTGEVIEELDSILSSLRNKIARLPYGDKVNLIVTSDHGMGPISSKRYVNIYDHVDVSWIDYANGSNPVYLLDVVDNYTDTVVEVLNKVEGISSWKKEDIPEHLHYGTHPRIPEVLVLADSSWSVGVREDGSGYHGGTHGYDQTNTDMHAIFYADGPVFKDDYIHPAFENVNLYILISHILGLDPADTDGDLKEVSGMLK